MSRFPKDPKSPTPATRTTDRPYSPTMPWTPHADWMFTVLSTSSLVLICWLVLRPGDPGR